MRKRTWVLVVSLCLLIALTAVPFSAACAGPSPAPGPSEETVFELKMQNTYPPLHRLTPDAFHWWGKEIENRTNGRVQMIWFDGGTLAAGPEAYEAIRDGIADGGTIDLIREDPLFDLMMWGAMPYHLQNSWQGSPVMWEIYSETPELQQLFADSSVRPVWFHFTDIANIHTLKDFPIKTVADAKGVSLYSMGIVFSDIIEAMGGDPISFPWGDSYTAAERGTLDGFIWPWAPIRSVGITDFLVNHCVLNMSMVVWGGFMNPTTWNSFPPEIQQVFDDLGMSMCGLSGATLTNEASDLIKEMQEKNHFFYEPTGAERDEWVNVTGKPIHETWIARGAEKDSVALRQGLIAKMDELAPKYADNAYGFDDWWGLAGRVWLLED